MDVFTIFKKRRSIRVYINRPVPNEAIERIIDSARFAATARNVQPWHFIAITNKVTLKKLASLADNGVFIADAAACIAVFCEDTKYYLEDGCAATQNIILAATALGIGSCWVAGDKKPYCAKVSELLNAPNSYKLVSLVALGYPESVDVFKEAEKKPLDKLIHWEKF